MKHNNDIDDLFKQSFEDVDIPDIPEEYLNDINQKLDALPPQKAKSNYRFLFLTIALLSISSISGFFYLSDNDDTTNEPKNNSNDVCEDISSQNPTPEIEEQKEEIKKTEIVKKETKKKKKKVARSNSDGELLKDAVLKNKPKERKKYSVTSGAATYLAHDYFDKSSTDNTTISIKLPAECNSKNTQVWIAFPSINSIMTIKDANQANPNIFETPNIAVNINAKLIVVLKSGDQYQSGIKPFTVEKDANETISLTPTTLEQFTKDLSSL